MFSIIDTNWARAIFSFDTVEFTTQDRWANANGDNTRWACNNSHWRGNISTVDPSRWCNVANRRNAFTVHSSWWSSDGCQRLKNIIISTFLNILVHTITHNWCIRLDVVIRQVSEISIVTKLKWWSAKVVTNLNCYKISLYLNLQELKIFVNDLLLNKLETLDKETKLVTKEDWNFFSSSFGYEIIY